MISRDRWEDYLVDADMYGDFAIELVNQLYNSLNYAAVSYEGLNNLKFAYCLVVFTHNMGL